MYFSRKAFVVALIGQILPFVLLFFFDNPKAESSGILGVVVLLYFLFYLYPLMFIKLLIFGTEPTTFPKPIGEILLCILVVIYAGFISWAYCKIRIFVGLKIKKREIV